MPDRWPYTAISLVAIASLCVTGFGVFVALAARNWIVWALWATAAVVLVAAFTALIILRRRLDRAAAEANGLSAPASDEGS